MKAIGIVRKVDDLGRIVLPVELRRTLDVALGGPLEIFVDGQDVILRKYQPGCTLCGSAGDTTEIFGKLIGRSCVKRAAKALKAGENID